MTRSRQITIGALAGLIILAMASAPFALAAYGADVSTAAGAISCGDVGLTNPASYGFDKNTSTQWNALQTGTGINGVSCLGQQFFMSGGYNIGHVLLKQGAANALSSVLWQYSDNGVTWTTADTLTITQDAGNNHLDTTDVGPHSMWRILANSTTNGTTWSIAEFVTYARFSVTNTPVATATAAATATPTATYTPTPDYYIQITSTAGSPMRIERSASFGDIVLTGAIMVLLLVFVIYFAYRFFHKDAENVV